MIVAIDPSIRALGIAAFNLNNIGPYFLITSAVIKIPTSQRPKTIRTKQFCTRKTTKLERWVWASDRMTTLTLNTYQEILTLQCQQHPSTFIRPTILIEMPTIYGPSPGHSRVSSKADAARNSGAIAKMFFFIASLRNAIAFLPQSTTTKNSHPPSIHLIPVRTWKGQTPKHVTQHRIKRTLGYCPEDHNEADAVGIGLWYLSKTDAK